MACLWMWEEARVPGENARRHGDNMQTPHRPTAVILYVSIHFELFSQLKFPWFPYYTVRAFLLPQSKLNANYMSGLFILSGSVFVPCSQAVLGPMHYSTSCSE